MGLKGMPPDKPPNLFTREERGRTEGRKQGRRSRVDNNGSPPSCYMILVKTLTRATRKEIGADDMEIGALCGTFLNYQSLLNYRYLQTKIHYSVSIKRCTARLHILQYPSPYIFCSLASSIKVRLANPPLLIHTSTPSSSSSSSFFLFFITIIITLKR